MGPNTYQSWRIGGPTTGIIITMRLRSIEWAASLPYLTDHDVLGRGCLVRDQVEAGYSSLSWAYGRAKSTSREDEK